MINKKSLWFLTLFSLILVLSVYYITMPSELLMTSNNIKTNEVKKDSNKKQTSKSKNKKAAIEVAETSNLDAMRVEAENSMNEEIEALQVVLNDKNASAKEKNEAYDKMKQLNNNKAEEESLEDKIKKDFNLDCYIVIDNNNIKVTIAASEHDATLANKIMRSIQSNYEESKYITVQFKK